MRIRYLLASRGAAVLLASLAAFSAASSPVADAAMKRDEAAVAR